MSMKEEKGMTTCERRDDQVKENEWRVRSQGQEDEECRWEQAGYMMHLRASSP
jgi:hypothetical protein